MSSFLQKALVYLSAGVWTLTLVLMGVGVPEGFWKPLGIVSLLVSAITVAYEKWLWALIPFRFSGTPDLRGTWCGTLRSQWIDPATNKTPDPIEAYFVVRQTATTVTVAMFTKESRSTTVTARLEKTDADTQVVGVYRNEPQANVRHRSAIHYGGLRLHLGGPPPTTMVGTYWTDRSTIGDIDIERGTTEHAYDFATAQALCAGRAT